MKFQQEAHINMFSGMQTRVGRRVTSLETLTGAWKKFYLWIEWWLGEKAMCVLTQSTMDLIRVFSRSAITISTLNHSHAAWILAPWPGPMKVDAIINLQCSGLITIKRVLKPLDWFQSSNEVIECNVHRVKKWRMQLNHQLTLPLMILHQGRRFHRRNHHA